MRNRERIHAASESLRSKVRTTAEVIRKMKSGVPKPGEDPEATRQRGIRFKNSLWREIDKATLSEQRRYRENDVKQKISATDMLRFFATEGLKAYWEEMGMPPGGPDDLEPEPPKTRKPKRGPKAGRGT